MAPCCDVDIAAGVRADLLLALLRGGPRTYGELRAAGLDGAALQDAADCLAATARGIVYFGPWVELVPPPSRTHGSLS